MLGVVGAGGLGFVVMEFIRRCMDRQAGVALPLTLFRTPAIDCGSAYVRSRVTLAALLTRALAADRPKATAVTTP